MSASPEPSNNYEEQFAHRFTAEDKQYQQYLQCSANPPPIVEDWKIRGGGYPRGRDNRFQEYRPYRGRDRGRGWGWSGEQRNRWGSGGGEYGQGYNSYNQRPYY
ncbi:hypothetical protein JZ751_019454 [Albula glossodonta]|uniref:RNA guanine-7 methyltransferase activating subunit n=1 Tax=Albula glossodonta TaxID=121402 RepID=A0A8T2NM70_9TELE|nr:hypothetical protein JZ751_019454 [Albula glossodonta]